MYVNDVFQIPVTEIAPFLMDGEMTLEECEQVCPDPDTLNDPGDSSSSSGGPSTEHGALVGCTADPVDANTTAVDCQYIDLGFSCGRRPVGAASERPAPAPDPECAWLLAAAELEALSVPAFEDLAVELARHGAPAELRAAAVRAADEERGHAAAIGALVRRRGYEPRVPVVEPGPASDLEALARLNAVEGCVRETWGALLAAFQARHATAADVRAAQTAIAEDERAHAELAWRVDAWTRTRLSADARARVDAARLDAVRALSRAVERFGSGVPAVGLPNATQARTLLHGLRAALW